MQILGGFCLLVVVYSVIEFYKRVFLIIPGFLVMDCASLLKLLSQGSDFGCGFLVFGCFSRVFNFLGMLLIFVFCIKILPFGLHPKSLMHFLCEFRGKPITGFCLRHGVGEVCDSKIAPCKCNQLKFLENPRLPNKNTLFAGKENVNSNGEVKAKGFLEENENYNDDGECYESYDENAEFDALALRKLVKIERKRANAAYAELEKERMAAASAAEEAMAMILRLQSEKSSVEIQANQYRRMAEQKQEYDQEIIQSLRWIIMKHESQLSLLEDKLRLCRQKLKLYMKADEVDLLEGVDANSSLLNSTEEDDLDGSLISSLEMDSLFLPNRYLTFLKRSIPSHSLIRLEAGSDFQCENNRTVQQLVPSSDIRFRRVSPISIDGSGIKLNFDVTEIVQVYNVKAKLRQGNTTVKNYKSLRPVKSAVRKSSLAVNEPSWRQRNPPRVPNLIGGRFVDSTSSSSFDILNPATQLVVSQVPITTNEEFKAAVFAAKRAFSLWHNTPITTRQRIMFKFQELIHRDMDKIATNITTEHGKTLKDAYADVLCGLEVVEHACGLGSLQTGELVPNISNGVDTYSIREPLGVCAGICPFDFPAMIPLWMFPIAITCGNTFILKPSEKDPGAAVMLAELAIEAGLPNGVLNIVHGTNDIVNAICDDDDIKAISFVGSIPVGAYVYARASAKGKRIQSNVGAKNHAVVMPDASVDATLNALIAAGFGAAGQKCTSLCAVVFVGGFNQWDDKLVERAKALKVNIGTAPDTDLGPVISKPAKEHICRLIQASVECGARLVLDGRNIVIPGLEHGNFIGPTILCDVTPDMDCYKVSSFMSSNWKSETSEHGIGISGLNWQSSSNSGHFSVTPLPFSSFTSSKPTFAGDLNFDGKAGIQFYTQIKTVTQQWKDLLGVDEAPPATPGSQEVTMDS
ncbi:Methylmalonate-semialdehyde dehydrogenase [Quillaja saponaria]|uniref:Methylmalonate-semialdehyde dehydrogenase n=1 Tax=Quillaja saponaria TaxID=32244 RepID=A0AAD7M1U3_QUISA|nr:Methylmalonate-semialdehyde dehydrogenase [Quillaja saponaria]